MMRIIGGKYRGRMLRMPKGVKVRPTQDRVREAIFNIIREAVPDARVLDLYAGSGAFGIEALSRGASSIIFVDNNINCIKAIRFNLSALGERARCGFGVGTGISLGREPSLIRRDAGRAIARFRKEAGGFDIIFLDPPYHKNIARNCLIKIDACDILSKRGFVIAEHFIKDVMPEETGGLLLFAQRKYGDTIISFYRRENKGQEGIESPNLNR